MFKPAGEMRPPVRPLGSGGRLQGFQDLARYRVQSILLVSSLYDSFILAEDGQLSEVVLGEFLSLDLHHAPRLRHVSSGLEALMLVRTEGRYDLIIASTHVGDMSVVDLARKLAEGGFRIPVVSLAYDTRDLAESAAIQTISDVNRVFLWEGDVRILPAMVKYVEDRMNVEADTGGMGVQAIILIEDSVRYYSSFLPVIYSELLKHSSSLAPEGVNVSHRLMRLEARPKILLCDTYEEAWRDFERYQENILGVISDIEFPKDGALHPEAGVEFARRVRELQPDVPIMLQSSVAENEALAREIGAAFLLKDSPTLLHELRQFMIENFGFGDFLFRLPDGTVVSQARDLRTLEEQLEVAPAESLVYHSERNHFSKWLKARTEFALAHSLRPRRVSDFPTVEHLRQNLIDAIHEYRRQRNRGIVGDFDRARFDPAASFCRIGGGSLGGKGRGLAFVNFLLDEYGIETMFPGVQISVPPAVVLGTDVFDRFLDDNGLRDFAIGCPDDRDILRRFLTAAVPDDIAHTLGAFLDVARYPLAVRSSSLLEDSQYQPFAGIYETWMVPNSHPDATVRLAQLLEAVCRVYASTFAERAKTHLNASPYRLEEEKMAVVIQKVVGLTRGDRHYPDIAGVARSHNFYPMPPMRADEGIAAVALGLGATVVGGGMCVRFCPRYPHHLLQFSSVDDVLRNSQRTFYALPLRAGDSRAGIQDRCELESHGLDVAERDGSLRFVGSTYSPENDTVYDGISRSGVRLVSFAPILKHHVFPLAGILELLLDVGARGTSSAVEIEFAANLAVAPGQRQEFAFLQLRPVPLARELTELDVGAVDRQTVVCESTAVLGHGKIEDVYDLVVVDPTRLGGSRSRDVAVEVSRLNAELTDRHLPYVLIGVGRWGSSEPALGIPVTWDQISGARVIVEAGLGDFRVSPSQGSHFFQNLMAASIGYFTVNPQGGEGFVDWDWLAAQPVLSESAGVRRIHLTVPLLVKMNGTRHHGVIFKPAEG